MKKLHIAIVMLTLGILSASIIEAGQRGFRHRGHRGVGFGQGIGVLELTKDQRQSIDALRQEFRQTVQGIRGQVQEGDLTREEAKSRIKALREVRRAAVKDILTPEQAERLDQLRDENADRRGPRGFGRALRALDLSTEQREQIVSLRSQHKEAMRQLWSGGERPERDKIRDLRQAHREAVKAILTEEQLVMFMKLNKHRREHMRQHVQEAEETKYENDDRAADGRLQPSSGVASLLHNAPNPFNPETEIRFEVPTEAYVNLSVYNAVGQRVVTLVDDFVGAGIHAVSWHAEDSPSGVYFYRLESNGTTATNRMLLLR